MGRIPRQVLSGALIPLEKSGRTSCEEILDAIVLVMIGNGLIRDCAGIELTHGQWQSTMGMIMVSDSPIRPFPPVVDVDIRPRFHMTAPKPSFSRLFRGLTEGMLFPTRVGRPAGVALHHG